jgi:hypothetical protein
MGGECNYLLRVAGPDKRLEFVPDSEWKGPVMMSWSEDDCQRLLDSAEQLLLEGAHRLRLPVQVVRKERACGVVPTGPTIYEVLEELAITVQNQLQSDLPFCAFNGGNDVFVDVGNKSLGLEALMGYLGLAPAEVLHVGDRFTDSGNDSATRDCCSILWVANPEETGGSVSGQASQREGQGSGPVRLRLEPVNQPRGMGAAAGLGPVPALEQQATVQATEHPPASPASPPPLPLSPRRFLHQAAAGRHPGAEEAARLH